MDPEEIPAQAQAYYAFNLEIWIPRATSTKNIQSSIPRPTIKRSSKANPNRKTARATITTWWIPKAVLQAPGC